MLQQETQRTKICKYEFFFKTTAAACLDSTEKECASEKSACVPEAVCDGLSVTTPLHWSIFQIICLPIIN